MTDGKKIIFLDIDGTLSWNSLAPCPEDIDALCRARQAGHYVFINTGRASGFLPAPLLGVDYLDGYLCGCGTQLLMGGRQIFGDELKRPFLRQVADGAKIAQEIGPGAKVMGDFWHMSKEETSFFGAFVTAGPLLAHVHIASLKTRRIPGTDGAADDYVDGFKGLKFIGYRGAVSVEAGFPEVGRNAQNKPIWPNNAQKREILAKMSAMLREQWAKA